VRRRSRDRSCCQRRLSDRVATPRSSGAARVRPRRGLCSISTFESIGLIANLTDASLYVIAGNTHRRRKAFLEAATDSFRFDDVGDGVYSLDVEAPPYVFSAVKVTVENGVVKEALASEVGNVPLPVDQGLRMVPLRALQYFEQRGKFSLWAFVKTPYGAMIFFALFSVIVMPYLKVDPEEYVSPLAVVQCPPKRLTLVAHSLLPQVSADEARAGTDERRREGRHRRWWATKAELILQVNTEPFQCAAATR
jgi:hypothetical protein